MLLPASDMHCSESLKPCASCSLRHWNVVSCVLTGCACCRAGNKGSSTADGAFDELEKKVCFLQPHVC